jgi:hypothetical protein
MKIIASALFASMLAITLNSPAHAQQATAGNGQYAPLPNQMCLADCTANDFYPLRRVLTYGFRASTTIEIPKAIRRANFAES